MSIVYFDSSAFVKLLLDEFGSDLTAALWNACDGAVSSRLAYPEVCAALAAAERNHVLTRSQLAGVMESWEAFWASVYPIEFSPEVEQLAGRLAQHHRLRGADAVHLASALALGDGDLVMAVWDKRLHVSAVEAHLAVAPASLA